MVTMRQDKLVSFSDISELLRRARNFSGSLKSFSISCRSVIRACSSYCKRGKKKIGLLRNHQLVRITDIKKCYSPFLMPSDKFPQHLPNFVLVLWQISIRVMKYCLVCFYHNIILIEHVLLRFLRVMLVITVSYLIIWDLPKI